MKTKLQLCMALALVLASGAQAEPRTTAATLLDRLQIEDLVTDYYAQLGGEIKGKAAIKAMYAGLKPVDPAKPRPRMNVMVSNPRITVTGNTAHGEFIYTGVVVAAPDKAPELHEQGREIDEFVKVKGEWKIKRREIINDANAGLSAAPPAKPAG